MAGTHAGEWNKLVDDLRSELMAAGVGLQTGFGPVPWSRPTPPAGWIWADGSVLLSDTLYPALRAAYITDGFPYGQDGSGNPKVPDMRGVVPAGRDNLGGTAANRLTGATALGALLGAETHTLTTAQMPSHAHTASTAAAGAHTPSGSTDTEPAHSHTASTATGGSHTHTVSAHTDTGGSLALSGSGNVGTATVTSSSHAGHTHTVTVNTGGSHAHALTMNAVADHTHTVTVNANGSGAAHNNVQPTIVVGYIVKA